VSTPISIPKLGVSMTEGTLVEWLVADGDTVSPGDVLYRIETDKVENDIEAPVGGVVRTSGVEGETYEVGTLIGSIE
jgi:pyruvate/2-oxoglutarate dehydrogenase complex dihydrolipoamide acyltransferase (E2) component